MCELTLPTVDILEGHCRHLGRSAAVRMPRHVTSLLCILCLLVMPFPSYGWFSRIFSSRRCYTRPNVGCFSNSHPHNNLRGFLPQSPDDLGVAFRLNHRGQRRTNFNVYNARRSLRDIYQPNLPTVVLLHGYFEHCDSDWVTQMTDELLRKEQMNVICADWQSGARNLIYFQSASNARMVGAIVALMVQELVVHLGADVSRVHLIGYSLGAHVAGHAGKRINGLGRITGLDPAGPNFDDAHPSARLHHTDAILVDVYHTDAGERLPSLGASNPMGDVDYYVNGGSDQPGCSRSVGHISRVLMITGRLSRAFACDHHRSTVVFMSSIRGDCQFPTYRCSHAHRLARSQCQRCTGSAHCPNMGYNLPTDVDVDGIRGIYWTETTASEPFC